MAKKDTATPKGKPYDGPQNKEIHCERCGGMVNPSACPHKQGA